MISRTREHDPYAIRRWVTLGASTLAAMCCGFFYAWSVLSKPMMQMYGWTSAQVALAFTILVGIPAVCALLAGKLQQYMKPSSLLLLAGIILGLGTVLLSFATSLGLLYTFAFITGLGGMAYPGATMANLMHFFPDKRGLVSGILTGGFGVGAMVWGPVTVLLVDRVGLVWSLRVLGIVFAVVIASCSRLVSIAPVGYAPRGWIAPAVVSALAEEHLSLDWKRMLQTISFWLLAAVFVLGVMSGMMVTAHASPIAQQKLGISATAAGAFVSYLAFGMVAGKIVWGALSDRLGRVAVLLSVLAISVAALILLWQTNVYALVVVGIFAVGLCYGGFLALIGPSTGEAFGHRHFAVNFGIMYLSVAVASFGGPRLAAAIVEADAGTTPDHSWWRRYSLPSGCFWLWATHGRPDGHPSLSRSLPSDSSLPRPPHHRDHRTHERQPGSYEHGRAVASRERLCRRRAGLFAQKEHTATGGSQAGGGYGAQQPYGHRLTARAHRPQESRGQAQFRALHRAHHGGAVGRAKSGHTEADETEGHDDPPKRSGRG